MRTFGLGQWLETASLVTTRRSDRLCFSGQTEPQGQAKPESGAEQKYRAEFRKPDSLVPDQVPAYFLHGTFRTGEAVRPLLSWFRQSVSSTQPVYISYIPEIEKASGIEQSEPVTLASEDVFNLSGQSAYLMVLRDLGDFRCQVLHQNLKRLQGNIRQWQDLPLPEKNQTIARYFDLLPETAESLAPIVEQALIQPVFNTPGALRQSRLNIQEPSLAALTEATVAKVLREVDKLNVGPVTRWAREIWDTHELYARAQESNKRLNVNPDYLVDDLNTINLRPIGFYDILKMEAYLLYLQEHLAEALKPALATMCVRTGSSAEIDRLASSLAGRLVDKLTPQGMAFGHSQGGTALHAALLQYVSNAPKSYREIEQAFDHWISSQESQPELKAALSHLAGRYMGLNIYLSAPMKGIPPIPAWGKPIIGGVNHFEQQYINFFHRKNQKLPNILPTGTSARFTKWAMWKLIYRDRPGVQEMQQGSDLMRKFETQLEPVTKASPSAQGRSVFSLFDRRDIFVEPQSSVLSGQTGQTPSNVFNVLVEADMVSPVEDTPEELISGLLAKIKHSNNPTRHSRLARHLPKRIKQTVYQAYVTHFRNLSQHRALVVRPQSVSNQVGQALMGNPQRLKLLLNPVNFEPLRYQALCMWRHSFNRLLALPTVAQQAMAFQAFQALYPDMVTSLIENVRTVLPLQTSAALPAEAMLKDILELSSHILKQPPLQRQYAPMLCPVLEQVAAANLPFSDEPSLSEQAKRCLEYLHKQTPPR